jgi:Asp-tRNA(Asn)/Glu-tRNA(Gln) amidotransferase A subunit family amidase
MTTESLITEATITELHEAMRAGNLTSRALIERYLDRIEAYDRTGSKINAIVNLNPNAKQRASTLDERFEQEGLTGKLHGVPVLVKDQVSTADIVTTYGSEAFAEYMPSTDATIVRRLRDAGAIVLGKTNLPDWAAGFIGHSSVAGQTKNPYALDRSPGGSSSGTGAGVAANLGTIGIGEDTGGSIRVPASCCNLYGFRPTTGLVSRTGISPLVGRQDTAGPMTRTVDDMVRLFDALVGFDPTDERTGSSRLHHTEESYRSAMKSNGLDGRRLGVLRSKFGDGPRATPVTETVDRALETLTDAGAELVDPVEISALSRRLDRSSLHALQPKHDIDAFLESLEEPPVDSIAELHSRGAYNEALELFETIVAAPDDPTDDPTYWRSVAAQESLREAIIYCLADRDLDALVFPDVAVVPPRYEAIQRGEVTRADYPVNTVISSQSSCPSISMPAGFTDDGLPVGVELLAAPYNELLLFEMAAAYERRAKTRRPPTATPPLEE